MTRGVVETDYLVNNTGLNVPALIGEYTESDFRRMVELNMVSTAMLTQAAVPHLAAGDGSAILNISTGGSRKATLYPALACDPCARCETIRVARPRQYLGLNYLIFGKSCWKAGTGRPRGSGCWQLLSQGADPCAVRSSPKGDRARASAPLMSPLWRNFALPQHQCRCQSAASLPPCPAWRGPPSDRLPLERG